MVTTEHWRDHAPAALDLRDRLCLGLHLNLTWGSPLGEVSVLASDGELSQGRTFRVALTRQTSAAVGVEIERQLDRFEEEIGAPPDFVDGHHHVHVLPGVREALLGLLQRRYPPRMPLVRNPSDRLFAIIARRVAWVKAATVSALSRRFSLLLQKGGFLSNEGFSGFSEFGPIPFAREFDSFLIAPGRRHMIMCHPGLPEKEADARDTIGARRQEEYALLRTRADLEQRVWRPVRQTGLGTIEWPERLV
jgi:predicted glycoside hydrolase/deacetylase ChbG (UPF0249 family)